MDHINKHTSVLVPFGGVGMVTGANFMLKNDEYTLLVDCGMAQGDPNAGEMNRAAFGYNPAEVDFLFVTHAHLDHVGRIPKLIRDGFKGTIYSTPETKALAEHIMNDALSVMEYNSRKVHGPEPIYRKVDIETALALWQTKPYHEPFFEAGYSVVFKDAGHILGSAMIEFSRNGRSMVFTGDLGNSPSSLLKDTEPIGNPNYLLMESVYGDRNHEAPEQRVEKLKIALRRGIERGATILIPAFSMERTQVLLYHINNFIEDHDIPTVPVFLDSPLALRVTEIYKHSTDLFKRSVRDEIAAGDNIFDFPKFVTIHNSRESAGINSMKGAKIIIAGSGMSEGGRIVSHEIEHLPDHKNMIILVGYQAVGTVGRNILDGNKKVVIHEEKVNVNAEVINILGFSSHKDSDNLVGLVERGKDQLKKVFVAMGEPKASLFLAQRLFDEVGVVAVVPEVGKKYELEL